MAAITASITTQGSALLALNLTNSVPPLINLTSLLVGDTANVPFGGTETAPYGVLVYIGTADNISVRPSQNANKIEIDVVFPDSSADGDYFTIGNFLICTDTGVPFISVSLPTAYNKQNNALTVPVTITYTNINVCFDNSVQTDNRNMLDSMMRDIGIWDTLGNSVNTVMQAAVVEPRNQLKQLRNPDLFDRTLANRTAQMLGIRFFSDYFSDDAMSRIARYTTLYYSRKGTVDFVNLLSFLNNTHFTVTQLWTKDFVTFHSIPGDGIAATSDFSTDFSTDFGTPILISDGGPWYPTSHFSISYDSTDYPLVDGSSLYAEEEIKTLYYNIAPITHVIDSVTGIATPTPGYAYLAATHWDTSIHYSSNF